MVGSVKRGASSFYMKGSVLFTKGVTPSTIIAATTLPAGVRVIENAAGRCIVARNPETLGYAVTLHAFSSREAGQGACLNEGGTVPALASEAVRTGDDAYTAPDGKFGKKAANAIHIGKWIEAVKRDGIGQVQLLSRMVTRQTNEYRVRI